MSHYIQLAFNFSTITALTLLVFFYTRVHKRSLSETAEKEEVSKLLTQISLQKDEIEALYEETYAINEELNKSQQELEIHIKELTAMNEIAHTINSSLSIDDVLKHICTEACKILEYDLAIILTADAIKDKLIVKHWEGPEIESIHEMVIDIHKEGICGHVARTRQPILVKDVNNFNGYINIHHEVKQEMSSPLLYGDELIGVFNIASFNEYTFDEQKLALLCSFANMAAMALKNASLYANISSTYYHTSKALAKAIEAKDTYTKGHCDRVTELSMMTAELMGFDNQRIRSLRFAATLHDIGKIGVSERILNKPGPLLDEEMNLVKLHPTIGYNILSEIDFLEYERNIIYQHHERFDGTGYPLGLSGSEILLDAKILALSDSFDAMTSKRSYRDPMPLSQAIEQIRINTGTQFDPEVAKIFIEMIEKEEKEIA